MPRFESILSLCAIFEQLRIGLVESIFPCIVGEPSIFRRVLKCIIDARPCRRCGEVYSRAGLMLTESRAGDGVESDTSIYCAARIQDLLLFVRRAVSRDQCEPYTAQRRSAVHFVQS